MKTQIEKQLEYLQNAGTCYGLTIHIFHSEDKRKAPLFFAQKGVETISPNLDYSNLNHFLLGYGEALKLFNQKDVFNVKETDLTPAEKWLMDVIQGVKPEIQPDGNVHWYKDGRLLFEQDFKNVELWVSSGHIWWDLQDKFGLSDNEIKNLLAKVLYDYTDNGKLKVAR